MSPTLSAPALRYFFAISSVLLVLFGKAQEDCGQPPLCADAGPENVLMTGLDPIDLDCGTYDYQQVYSFITNSINADDEATITIDNVVYPDETMPGEIAAQVMLPAAGLPDNLLCDQALWQTYQIPCQSDVEFLEFDLDNLASNTAYFILIGSDTDSVTFDIAIEGPAVDISACCPQQVRQGLEIFPLSVEGGNDYQWEPLGVVGEDQFQSENPVFTPQESVTVTVSGTVGECTVTDEVFIEVTPPLQPFNAITPNGDGVNDLWTLPGVQDFDPTITTITVSIYDRWGQLIFKSVGYPEPWDGTNRGKRLPTGTYYYVIDIRSTEVEIDPLVGPVSIIH